MGDESALLESRLLAGSSFIPPKGGTPTGELS